MLRGPMLFRFSKMSSFVLLAALVACDNTRGGDTSTSAPAATSTGGTASAAPSSNGTARTAPSISEPTSPSAIERTGGSDEEARDTSGNPASGNLGAGERTSQRGAGGSHTSGLGGTSAVTRMATGTGGGGRAAGGGGAGGGGGMRSTE